MYWSSPLRSTLNTNVITHHSKKYIFPSKSNDFSPPAGSALFVRSTKTAGPRVFTMCQNIENHTDICKPWPNYQPQLLSQISSIKQLSLFPHYHLPLPLAKALYFGLTTLTTVGFGDITPITAQGRFVVAFSILAGVAVFPYQFSRLAEVQLKMYMKHFSWNILSQGKWWYPWDGTLNNQPHIHLI